MMFWVFCGLFFLSGGAQGGSRNGGALWDISWLTCGQRSLVFSLLPNQTEMAPLVLRALDAEGRSHALQSNPACGTRVEQQADGSMVVEAFYTGCYVHERDGSFVMTVQVDSPVASYKEELRCPNHLLAGDAPSPSVCSAVQSSARLPCAAPPIARGDCEELGCCYQPGDRLTPCYYGDKVTAQCTPDGQFSVAISRDVTMPPLDLSSVHLVSAHGSRCAPVSRNEAFVVYRFPLSACGTTVQTSGDQRVYENELVADRQVLTSRSGSITRDSTFRLTIRCSYSAEDFLPVNVVVSTLPPPPPAVGQGPLALEMRIATDEHYSTYYADHEYPVVKLLRDPVHVEVRILQRTDPGLVLILHQCWATPSTNPLQQPEWPILVDGCPYEGDNYQTQLVPVGEASGLQFPSHHQRFIVSTFTFVDATSQRALSGPVYFHCSASACLPSRLEHCVVQCPTNLQGRARRASQSQTWGKEPLSLVTAEGPVDFHAGQEAEEDLAQEGSHGLRPLVEWGEVLVPLAGAVAAVAVAVVVALGLRKLWGRRGHANGTTSA
ncbi:zona pellucida sperm-binding protein 4-like [Mauremys mutica]|uniref:zona pellucida sperm-binding protein 4-like n=1 Tax=Mauremys mutica TaxID=74926 RepID=UPI001D167197|nr:zona pellucida sperm-binding protein 4-like [Mauremys mutica]